MYNMYLVCESLYMKCNGTHEMSIITLLKDQYI